jgi:hypothetical protein
MSTSYQLMRKYQKRTIGKNISAVFKAAYRNHWQRNGAETPFLRKGMFMFNFLKSAFLLYIEFDVTDSLFRFDLKYALIDTLTKDLQISR